MSAASRAKCAVQEPTLVQELTSDTLTLDRRQHVVNLRAIRVGHGSASQKERRLTCICLIDFPHQVQIRIGVLGLLRVCTIVGAKIDHYCVGLPGEIPMGCVVSCNGARPDRWHIHETAAAIVNQPHSTPGDCTALSLQLLANQTRPRLEKRLLGRAISQLVTLAKVAIASSNGITDELNPSRSGLRVWLVHIASVESETVKGDPIGSRILIVPLRFGDLDQTNIMIVRWVETSEESVARGGVVATTCG
mmetsp:Transcript_7875/g.18556  ORF Transcript_7875/g.18556 Transcript_7875/m.18556 type:complete len:249 (-) Transcript_7875:164-910(-)